MLVERVWSKLVEFFATMRMREIKMQSKISKEILDNYLTLNLTTLLQKVLQNVASKYSNSKIVLSRFLYEEDDSLLEFAGFFKIEKLTQYKSYLVYSATLDKQTVNECEEVVKKSFFDIKSFQCSYCYEHLKCKL